MVDVRTDILPEELTEEDKWFVVQLLQDFEQQNEQFIGRGERAKMPQPAKSLDDFIALTKESIEAKEHVDNTPEENKILFTAEYPPTELETVTVSYSLLRREPASTSGGRHFNQQRQEWKPHVREIIDDPNNPGYKLIILGQKFENIVQFIIWAKTNKEANKRATWFEDLMREYAWFIKYKGVNEFYMLERGEDIILDIDQQRVVGRPFHFYVRTEKLTYLSEPTIRRVMLELGIK
jgi:hypothetical protein